MKLSKTDFDYNLHSVKKISGGQTGDYLLFDVDVYNDIEIGGNKFGAVYQAAQGFYNENLQTPRAELALSPDGGTDPLLVSIDELCETDFDNSEYISEKLEEIMELCPAINTKEKLRKVYSLLNNNLPFLQNFVDEGEYDIDKMTEGEHINL